MARIGAFGVAFALTAILMLRTASAADWLPIDPRELQMTSEPNAPGAPAVYLYREVERSDVNSTERVYVRIKILNEEGLKYANVEIPFDGQYETVGFIEARTIHPDGTSVAFDGKVYETTVVKTRGEKLLNKTLTLPAVQVGSIIEYRYTHVLRRGWIYDSRWILSAELYTEHAKFSLEPEPQFSLRWSWPRGLPAGSTEPTKVHNAIRFEAHGIPAFVEEDYMPPADEMRTRVDFIYDFSGTNISKPDEYWKDNGRRLYRDVQKFAVANHAMAQAVATIIAPTDSAEEKLRKIYARVEQLDNLSYEPQSQQEAKQQKAADISDVADVWQKGYGDGLQITWLYLALVRAAGIAADPMLIATRDRYFFDKRLMNAGELNSNLVLVQVDGKQLYLDPGVPFTPFGLLPWWETGVEGLRLGKEGATWLDTPVPVPADSRIERKATLKLDRGTLAGKLTVTYTGLEAAARRLNELAQDDTQRKQYLEDEVQRAIPTGITVTLTNTPDWNAWDAPLIAQYDLEVPGWGVGAGRRMLLPVTLFGAEEKAMFTHVTRTQPLYFENFYQHLDDVTIELPAGWVADSVPEARNVDLKRVIYRTTLVNGRQTLHFTRQLDFGLMLLLPTAYDSLRKFYQVVQAADVERAVVSIDPTAAARH